MNVTSTLLIVDVQKGFVTPHSQHVVKPITQLQHCFERVVVTKFYNPDPSPFRRILQYYDFSPGGDDTELAFTPREDAIILERPLYTCVNEALKQYLAQHHITELYVCGIASEACVLKTVMDLFEHNVRCWVITDLCASDKGQEYHDMAMTLIGKLIQKSHLLTAALSIDAIRKS